ncbi:YncE family protein [Mycolicibacterium canariasense]|nr:YncE family protein [Mycolicibacterium canariasense]
MQIGRGAIADVAADSTTIVVANHGDGSVTVVRPDTVAAPAVVDVAGEPTAIALAEDRAYVVTGTAEVDTVVVVDTRANAVLASYPLAFTATAVEVSRDGKRAYVARTGNDHVDIAVIDTTAERVGTIDIPAGIGASIDGLRIAASGRELYAAVTTVTGSRLLMIDTETATVRKSLSIGAPIRDLALTKTAAYVLTSDLTALGAIVVVDLAAFAVTGTVAAGALPIQMALSADGSRAYVVDYDQVSVLCTVTNDVLETITVGSRPTALALSGQGDRLYVADVDGRITAFRVTPPSPMYSPFEAVAFPEARQLEPVGV